MELIWKFKLSRGQTEVSKARSSKGHKLVQQWLRYAMGGWTQQDGIMYCTLFHDIIAYSLLCID